MPYAPAKPCKHPRCAALAQPGSAWCTAHQPAARAEQAATRQALDGRRGSAHSRGYDARWAAESRRLRSLFPISFGYLVPTSYWSPNLAHQFNTLRMAAQAAGHFARFMLTDGAGLRFLAEFPIYAWHPSRTAEPSEVTDHIAPHRGNPTLMWAEWNLQPLSKRQHDTKTASEDGGFRGARSSSQRTQSQATERTEETFDPISVTSVRASVPSVSQNQKVHHGPR